MIDLIEAYCEHSPYEKALVLRDKGKGKLKGVTGIIRGQAIPYTYMPYEPPRREVPVEDLFSRSAMRTGIGYMPRGIQPVHDRGSAINWQGVAVENQVRAITESYIGRPYNIDTTRMLENDIRQALAENDAPISITQDYAGNIRIQVGDDVPNIIKNEHDPRREGEKKKRNEGAVNLIDAYNERYKPLEVPVGFVRVQQAQPLSTNESDSYDIYSEQVRLASEAAARAMDRQMMGLIQDASSMYEDEDDADYSEEYLRAMPLTITDIPHFSVEVRNDYEEMPSYVGSIRREHRLRSSMAYGEFSEITGMLTTGKMMIRNDGMSPGRYLRSGRDGRIYEYNINTMTATLFSNDWVVTNGEVHGWYFRELEKHEQWFDSMPGLTNRGRMRYSIIDTN